MCFILVIVAGFEWFSWSDEKKEKRYENKRVGGKPTRRKHQNVSFRVGKDPKTNLIHKVNFFSTIREFPFVRLFQSHEICQQVDWALSEFLQEIKNSPFRLLPMYFSSFVRVVKILFWFFFFPFVICLRNTWKPLSLFFMVSPFLLAYH